MRLATASLCLALAACSRGGTPPDVGDWVVVPGQVGDFLSSIQAVSGPTTARVGVPLVMTVVTVGSGSCTRAAGATVTLTTPRLADVVPLDRVYRGTTMGCTDDLATFPRDVAVTFTEPGDAVVRVRSTPAGGNGRLTFTEWAVRVER